MALSQAEDFVIDEFTFGFDTFFKISMNYGNEER